MTEGKAETRKQMYGRLDIELFERVQEYARRTRRTQNAALHILLESGLAVEEAKGNE